MNKKYILLLLTFVIIFSSCESGNSEGSTSTTNTGEKYRTGTQGLLISFVPGVPPAKVFSDSEIGAIFEIKNKGSTDIDGAKLYLTGYEK